MPTVHCSCTCIQLYLHIVLYRHTLKHNKIPRLKYHEKIETMSTAKDDIFITGQNRVVEKETIFSVKRLV